MSGEQPRRDWMEVIGGALVVLGLGMWGVYAIARYVLHMPVTDRQFLPYHLATVLPGMVLWQHRFLTDKVKKMLGRRSR